MNNKQSGMTLIVKTVTRLTVGLIFLFGVYLVLNGHLSPGGGFAGGVVIALSFVHIMLAYGKDMAFKRITGNFASTVESLGALLFISIALLGLSGGYFFLNVLGHGKPFQLFSAGTIPLSNIAIALKVSAGLSAIFIALVIFDIGSKDK